MCVCVCVRARARVRVCMYVRVCVHFEGNVAPPLLKHQVTQTNGLTEFLTLREDGGALSASGTGHFKLRKFCPGVH